MWSQQPSSVMLMAKIRFLILASDGAAESSNVKPGALNRASLQHKHPAHPTGKGRSRCAWLSSAVNKPAPSPCGRTCNSLAESSFRFSNQGAANVAWCQVGPLSGSNPQGRPPQRGHSVSGVFTPVLVKHTKSRRLVDILAVRVHRMQRNFDPMRKQVITLFFGKIDHHDLRVLTQPVEHDLFPVAGDVEGPHGGTVLKPGEWTGLHGCEIE